MYPTTSTNLDVIVSDSITPATKSTYNLGQDRLRWKHIFSDDVVCDTIWFAQPGSYTTGIDLTAERLIDNENRIELNSIDCELLKTNAPLYALKTVVNPIASDVTTLKADVAKLKTDYAALLSIVNKLSMAPAANNTTFWNSLRRLRYGVYDYSSDNGYMYFIPTAYIVGDLSPTIITLSGVDYYSPELKPNFVSIEPAVSFGVVPYGTRYAWYTVYNPGSSSPEPVEWRQALLNGIENAGFIWRRFS